ncbi:hypothetical protein PsYK624_062570 [Phanerochaete sordida]|uniref:Uncharacterized protein n=1 Tax=Phanerochaete sordida TaxID=48140 RepID=A0A9P3LDA5_9APHY|nr:hypothetical protein PsYK624_062570 [Phanerochaete sordida]
MQTKPAGVSCERRGRNRGGRSRALRHAYLTTILHSNVLEDAKACAAIQAQIKDDMRESVKKAARVRPQR